MPGVPPDALDTLKRAFKGMFKRGKKGKQDQQNPTTTTSASQPTSAQSSSAQPAAQASASQPNTDKKLPPTHPFATGQHDQPQEAVPQNHAAQPGPPTPLTTQAATDGAKNKPEIPSTSAVPAAESQSDPVSAVEQDSPPIPPPKNDASMNVAPPAAAREADMPITNNDHTHTTLAAQKLDPTSQISKSEPTPLAQADGTAEEPLAAHPKPLSENTTTAIPATIAHSKSADEKMPVIDEPPPPPPADAKPVKVAPGMSATSGPLEDFPEGAFAEEERPH